MTFELPTYKGYHTANEASQTLPSTEYGRNWNNNWVQASHNASSPTVMTPAQLYKLQIDEGFPRGRNSEESQYLIMMDPYSWCCRFDSVAARWDCTEWDSSERLAGRDPEG